MTTRAQVCVAALLAVWVGPSRADHIRLTSGVDFKSVQVTGVSDGQVIFRSSTGQELRKPLAQIGYVSLDSMPSLANVERLMDRAEYRKAADGYERLAREATTTWQKRLIESRLLRAYDREGRFDKAVETYVGLVVEMGAAVEDLGPTNFPSPGSRLYEPALGAVERVAVANNVSAESRAVLERFAAAVRAVQSGGGDSSAADDSAAPHSAADGSSAARPALAQARAALAAGRFDEVVRVSEAALANVPKEARPELLYLKGVAELKLAGSRAARLSAGLTLMRVVAADESSAFAAAALYQVGLLYETLGRPAKALELLEEAQSHPAAEAALKADAAAAIARLQAEQDGTVKR